jgi:hypothetical protein
MLGKVLARLGVAPLEPVIPHDIRSLRSGSRVPLPTRGRPAGANSDHAAIAALIVAFLSRRPALLRGKLGRCDGGAIDSGSRSADRVDRITGEGRMLRLLIGVAAVALLAGCASPGLEVARVTDIRPTNKAAGLDVL